MQIKVFVTSNYNTLKKKVEFKEKKKKKKEQ